MRVGTAASEQNTSAIVMTLSYTNCNMSIIIPGRFKFTNEDYINLFIIYGECEPTPEAVENFLKVQ